MKLFTLESEILSFFCCEIVLTRVFFRNASNWSADRVMKQYPEFMYASPDGNQPVLFTGEMVSTPENPISDFTTGDLYAD